MRSITLAVLIVASSIISTQAREWTDATKNQKIEGDFIECKVTLRLPNGKRRVIDLATLTADDQKFILEVVQNQAANQAPGKKAAAAVKPANANRRNVAQQHTEFGSVKLTEDEIKEFIADCKKRKPLLLQIIQTQMGRLADKMTPAEVDEAKRLFQFLSQDNVLIAPRAAGDEKFCKPIGGGEQNLQDFGTATTEKIIDKNTAYVTLSNVGGTVILEGIDTKRLAIGPWDSRFLLKVAGKRKVPGIVGDFEVPVFQAVSAEGFPKDIIIW